MEKMFYNCKSLKKLNLFSFKTDKVLNMTEMFNGCINLEDIDLTEFNFKNVKFCDNMFLGCEKISYLTCNNIMHS